MQDVLVCIDLEVREYRDLIEDVVRVGENGDVTMA